MKKKKSKENEKRIAFIDASNLIYGAKKEGWKIDFRKLYYYLRQKQNCSKLMYFGGIDEKNVKQVSFYKMLERIGYKLFLIQVKTFSDGSKKADCDSRLTFEIMKNVSGMNSDKYVLCTGDGDYFWVFEFLIKKNKEPKLFSFKRTTARELKSLFKSSFTDLNSLRHKLKYDS